MNVCDSLTISARLFPDHTAMIWNDQRISYSQLEQWSQLAAQRLLDAGVKPADRVAIMLPNAPAFPVWYYATLRIGAIAVSISTRLAGDEIGFIIDDCQATGLVSNSDGVKLAESLASSLAFQITAEHAVSDLPNAAELSCPNRKAPLSWYQADPQEPALILYTSGTTGFPKGATLSHQNVRTNVHTFNHLCNMRPHDVVLLAVPLFHCFGQNAILNSVLNVGGTLVMQQKFDLNETRRLIAEHQINQLYGVPMMFQLLLDCCEASDLESVEYCFSAAATLPIQVSTAWQEKFDLPIHQGYGLTETSPFASYNHRDRFLPGSIGFPVDGVEMKIVDTHTGRDCAPGELGEIVIRGPNVMLGYWNREAETRQAIRDGWFHSGDIGHVDEQGYFFIVDRVKDMISIGGLKVFPAEVERVLLEHPAVAQVAVVGTPDSILGEQVVAFVVPTADLEISTPELAVQLDSYAKNHLGTYKIPRRFFVVDGLPRNPSGKILKTELRRQADLAPATVPAAPVTEKENIDESAFSAMTLGPATLAQEINNAHENERRRIAIGYLQHLVQQISESQRLPDANDSLLDAGLDSLMIMEFVTQLQIEVGTATELSTTLVFDFPRISDLAQYLIEQLSPVDPSVEQPHSPRPNQAVGKPSDDLRCEIEQMSEEQALLELTKEIS